MSERDNQISELLNRSVVDCIDRSDLEKSLKSGKKLRIKFGIDPTGSQIHIGRAVPLRKLKAFQDLGHQIILIIGDFTARVGDTSDKDSERPMLDADTIEQNLSTYLDQITKILNMDEVEVRRNSEWLGKLDFNDIADLADSFSLAETNQRENFAKRLKGGKRVSLRECMYPLMQGYDSVAIKSDVEIGGQDQLFNLHAGRTLQKKFVQKPQNIMTFPILEGTDGRKMSTSWGNCIYLTDTASDMFGKIMSIPDNLIVQYFELVTDISSNQIHEIKQEMEHGANPRDSKRRLASEIVAMYHGEGAASDSANEFDNIFKKGGQPDDINELDPSSNEIIEVIHEAEMVTSKSEARRAISAGSVKINDQKIEDIKYEIDRTVDNIIQVGKRKWIKILAK